MVGKAQVNVLNGARPNGYLTYHLWRTGGVQQIQLRTEERQNGDLGALAP